MPLTKQFNLAKNSGYQKQIFGNRRDKNVFIEIDLLFVQKNLI